MSRALAELVYLLEEDGEERSEDEEDDAEPLAGDDDSTVVDDATTVVTTSTMRRARSGSADALRATRREAAQLLRRTRSESDDARAARAGALVAAPCVVGGVPPLSSPLSVTPARLRRGGGGRVAFVVALALPHRWGCRTARLLRPSRGALVGVTDL